VRSADALPSASVVMAAGAPEIAKCRVDVLRTVAGGRADITRSELSDGTCVCTVTTGPQTINGSAEDIVVGLLRDRECAGAPVAGGNPLSAGGSILGLLPAVVGAPAVGGLAAGLGSSSPG
jgi:hypothetical protein